MHSLLTPGREAFIPGSHNICASFRQLSLFKAAQHRQLWSSRFITKAAEGDGRELECVCVRGRQRQRERETEAEKQRQRY